MPTIAPEERRNSTRLEVDGLIVSVRRKGRLAKLIGMAVDFNRYGVAIITDQPLPIEAVVYLSLNGWCGHVDNVVGVVHNCSGQQTGYRCGIRFRTGSQFQNEPCEVEQQLTALEEKFVAPLTSVKE